jgi:hypothetical protein
MTDESSVNILAALLSLPCSICFCMDCMGSICRSCGDGTCPSVSCGTGHATRGYASSLSFASSLDLKAGVSPTLGRARKSKRVRSEGCWMKALANLSAASPNEAAIEPEMGLVVVGSDANWRKRS